MSSHDLREPCPGLEKAPGAVRLDHPFGQAARQVRPAILTGRHKADERDLIGTQSGAARLMVMDRSSGVALQPIDHLDETGQRLFPVRRPELLGEFVPDERPVIGVVLTQAQHQPSETPNDKPLRGGELFHRRGPWGSWAKSAR